MIACKVHRHTPACADCVLATRVLPALTRLFLSLPLFQSSPPRRYWLRWDAPFDTPVTSLRLLRPDVLEAALGWLMMLVKWPRVGSQSFLFGHGAA
jgi:hypothetical protein